MLTIFTTPKPFYGHFGIIQTNAIRSWLTLQPKPEVILFGKDEGTAETAAKFGLIHIPEVECNDSGTPLVSSMFRIAQDIASHKFTCYVNSDIILMSDFLPALQRIQKNRFLMVGQRWDLKVDDLVNFDSTQWEAELRTNIMKNGKLHPKTGIDYFIFPRGLFNDVPPFAIGRPGWDNWMIYQTRKLRASVIDGTKAIKVIHQNHDYSHHPDGTAGVWQGLESKRNIELMGGTDRVFTIEYATDLLTPQGLKPALSPRYIYFRMRAFPVLHPNFLFLLIPFKAFELASKVVRKIVRTIVAPFRIKNLAAT